MYFKLVHVLYTNVDGSIGKSAGYQTRVDLYPPVSPLMSYLAIKSAEIDIQLQSDILQY